MRNKFLIYIPLWLRLNWEYSYGSASLNLIYIPLWLRLNLLLNLPNKILILIYIPLWLRLNRGFDAEVIGINPFTFHYGLD